MALHPAPCICNQLDKVKYPGYLAAKKLLQVRDRPTAILAANDLMVLGAVTAAREAGLSVPGDMSLVGFDNLPLNPYGVT